MDNSIVISHVSKVYKLYKNPQDRVKEALSFTGKNYHNDFCALSDISFSVKRGTTLGIIGRNGAGKSTLLKLITGVATPTTGTIETNGTISALLELGTGFNPEYNGYENIYLNGTMRGFSKEQMDEKLDEIISFADIGEYINQPVKTYSSGMFARLAFSVMISFKPDILIVDEALSVGDIFFQQKCNTYMKEKMKGVTKLLVTHDMNSIANMADHVILLDKGKILQEGKPLEVIESYLKIMHNTVFAKKQSNEPRKEFGIPSAPTQENDSKDPAEKKAEILNGWTWITQDDIGGAGEVKIEACKIEINNVSASIVKPGDKVKILLRLASEKDAGNLIIGYTFKDKFGNSIFAQNTLGEHIKVENVKKDKKYVAAIGFHWPEVREGDYFLTMGIGEGEDQMVHVIQCWAHNIIHIEAIALKPMHGIINHIIEKFDLEGVND